MAEGNGKRFDPLNSFLIGILLTGLGAFIAYPHDVVTTQQLDRRSRDETAAIDGLREEIAGLRDQIFDLKGQLKAQKIISGP